MRDFFKKEVLDRTYEIFGVRQTDEEKMSDDDIRFLLDGLCQVSKNYEYIPQEEQKKIIRACMLKDKTYRNINLRLIAGWLEENGKKYFVETAHKHVTSNDPNYKPLEGDERDAMLTMWQNSLKQMNDTFTQASKPMGGGSRLREQFKELPTEPPKPEEAINETHHAVKSFLVEGIEVFANTQEEANEIFYGKPSNEKGVQKPDQNTEVSDNSPENQ